MVWYDYLFPGSWVYCLVCFRVVCGLWVCLSVTGCLVVVCLLRFLVVVAWLV